MFQKYTSNEKDKRKWIDFLFSERACNNASPRQTFPSYFEFQRIVAGNYQKMTREKMCMHIDGASLTYTKIKDIDSYEAIFQSFKKAQKQMV